MRFGGLIDPDRIAELLETGTPALFAERMLDIAHSAAGIEEVFVYRIGEGTVPETLASSSGLADAAGRVRLYARRFHRSDQAAMAGLGAGPGSGFRCRVSADSIANGDYRDVCFERPRFARKICFGWRRADHALIVSFYQRRDEGGSGLAQLGALAQIAMTGLPRLAARPAEGDALLREVERRLAQAHPALTAREREVCARTLVGKTAREIGEELHLGLGTVLTYRQRAYGRLGASRASDLLALVMN